MNYKGGILRNSFADPSTIDHDISVIGWGVENGVNYWTIRNSWGSYWGENGFIRVERGNNTVNVERDCAWGAPRDTWTDDLRHRNTPAENADRRKGNADDLIPESQKKEDKFLGEGDSKHCRIETSPIREQELKHVGTPSWE